MSVPSMTNYPANNSSLLVVLSQIKLCQDLIELETISGLTATALPTDFGRLKGLVCIPRNSS